MPNCELLGLGAGLGSYLGAEVGAAGGEDGDTGEDGEFCAKAGLAAG